MCKRVMKEETSPGGEVPFFKIGTFGKKLMYLSGKKNLRNIAEHIRTPKKEIF
jgi:hypothetical protein